MSTKLSILVALVLSACGANPPAPKPATTVVETASCELPPPPPKPTLQLVGECK